LDCCSPYSISFHHYTKLKRLEKIFYQCPRWLKVLLIYQCGMARHLALALVLAVHDASSFLLLLARESLVA
jgi:hypothetical protein